MTLISNIFTHHVFINAETKYQQVLNVYKMKFQNEWCLLPIDGWLAITNCEKYFKLKSNNTIELAFVDKCTFKDAQNNLYPIQLTNEEFEMITLKCQTGIVEFQVPQFKFVKIRNDKIYPDHTCKILHLTGSFH
jgi:hypothetical protein